MQPSPSSEVANRWDVLVAGAGMAGLAAALAAAQSGARVLVVEKRAQSGGQAAISAGAIWAPPELAAIREYVPDGDAELQELLVTQLPSDLDWLSASGLALSGEESLAGFGRGRVMQGGTSGRNNAFMDAFTDAAAAAGAQFRHANGLVSAHRENQSIVAILDDDTRHICHSLILATGGFQGSPELLGKYLDNERAAALMLRGLPQSNGVGLQVARSLGAAYGGDLSAFYGHTMPDHKLATEDMQPLTPYFARYGVLVNRNGVRFNDEAAARLEEENPQEGCRQPGGHYYLIFDRAIYETHGIDQGVISAVPSIDRLARLQKMGAPIIEATTLEELASALEQQGVSGSRFLQEIRQYNHACRNDTGSSLLPPRIRNGIALECGPFYAMRCVASITNTCGGIRINPAGQALAESGKAVPGLYVAGVDAGGVFGRHYAGFLGWALVSGRRCGQSAAQEAKA